MYRRTRKRIRKGAIAVLAAAFLIVLIAMVAFWVDIRHILVARTDLQRTADAAASYRCKGSADARLLTSNHSYA